MRRIRAGRMRRRSSMLPDADTKTLFLRFLLFLVGVTVCCLVIYQATSFANLVYRSSSDIYDNIAYDNSNFSLDNESFRLKKVLKEASMGDGTVILSTVNQVWASRGSVFDLFLESFRIGDRTSRFLNHLVIIALDREAYIRCLSVHTHCFALITEFDFSKEAYFMTPNYLNMMWRRIDFLRSVLEMGYNFIFTDADIMWFRDPFPRFYTDTDFQIACDHFFGNSFDLNNIPNGGFNYVKSNNRTIEFYKFWHSSRETYPGYHDQDVLNEIKHDPFITELGLSMRFLNTAYFGGLCEPSKNLNQVCTMHANCCLGLDSKLHDLRILLEDWRNFMSLPPSVRRWATSSWRAPMNCSLSSLHHHNSPIPDVNNEDNA